MFLPHFTHTRLCSKALARHCEFSRSRECRPASYNKLSWVQTAAQERSPEASLTDRIYKMWAHSSQTVSSQCCNHHQLILRTESNSNLYQYAKKYCRNNFPKLFFWKVIHHFFNISGGNSLRSHSNRCRIITERNLVGHCHLNIKDCLC